VGTGSKLLPHVSLSPLISLLGRPHVTSGARGPFWPRELDALGPLPGSLPGPWCSSSITRMGNADITSPLQLQSQYPNSKFVEHNQLELIDNEALHLQDI
jgi:hypothetical protein